MKRFFISALALVGVGAMMPAEVSAQFRVVKDGKAILVMEDEVPDYVDFEVGAQEDGHLTLEQLMAMTTVAVDKSADGKNGNVLTCSTTAPVSVKWSIPDYKFTSNRNHFTRKIDVGEYKVILDAFCADGTRLKAEYTVKCDVVTNPRKTVEWIYGGPDRPDQKPFSPAAWNAADLRFSDRDGNHFPFLSDEVYFDNMVLVFDISDATDDCEGRVMNGWWSARYDDNIDVKFTNGLWRLYLTDEIAKDCARGNGGEGRDLDIMITSGSCTINSVRCEENIMHDAPTVGEAVDLGLSVKWSNINVGATSPEQAGNYFAWGETKTKENYTWDTYKYGNRWNINKYTTDDGQSGSVWYDKEYGEFIGDGRTVLSSSDDAASVNWGGDWEMPTINDWIELKNYCSCEWTDNYNNTGMSGSIITSKAEGNHNSIFLPTAGHRYGSEGSYGYYWSSSLDENSSNLGRYVECRTDINPWIFRDRCYGLSVRPVCPSAGYTNGRVAVDLGLPSGKLWATCNVGADAPEDNGGLFAWGETESKSYYDWSTYKHMQSGKSDWHYITKYQREDKTQWKTWYDESGEFVGDNKTTLEASDDVATATWGKEWRMPTAEEWKELDENTTKEWTNDYFGTGVSGYILTSTKPGYENAYIFLPAAGCRGLGYEGSDGYYWSSLGGSNGGRSLYFNEGYFNPGSGNFRYYGQSVRPVCTK